MFKIQDFTIKCPKHWTSRTLATHHKREALTERLVRGRSQGIIIKDGYTFNLFLFPRVHGLSGIITEIYPQSGMIVSYWFSSFKNVKKAWQGIGNVRQ